MQKGIFNPANLLQFEKIDLDKTKAPKSALEKELERKETPEKIAKQLARLEKIVSGTGKKKEKLGFEEWLKIRELTQLYFRQNNLSTALSRIQVSPQTINRTARRIELFLTMEGKRLFDEGYKFKAHKEHDLTKLFQQKPKNPKELELLLIELTRKSRQSINEPLSIKNYLNIREQTLKFFNQRELQEMVKQGKISKKIMIETASSLSLFINLKAREVKTRHLLNKRKMLNLKENKLMKIKVAAQFEGRKAEAKQAQREFNRTHEEMRETLKRPSKYKRVTNWVKNKILRRK